MIAPLNPEDVDEAVALWTRAGSDNTAVLDFYDHLGYNRQDVLVLGRRLG